MTHSRHSNAVTLVEMLVVVAIIALLASLVLTLTLRVENQSKEKALANVFALLKSALREYHEYTGRFPLQVVRDHDEPAVHVELMYEALQSVPASREVLKAVSGTLVKGANDQPDMVRMHDPWGTALDYMYAPEDNFPELISAGPDKKFGTPDDISSRSE